MPFNQNLFNLGQALKEKREDKGLSLEQISEHIKVSVYILEGIEEAYVDRLPVYAYLRGFIIAYAKVLGISEKEIEKELKSLVPKEKETYLPDRASPSTEAEHLIEKDLRLTPVIVAILLLFVLGGILIFTNVIRSYKINPDLSLEREKEEEVKKTSSGSELLEKEEREKPENLEEMEIEEKPEEIKEENTILPPEQKPAPVKDSLELVVKALGEVTLSYQIDNNEKKEISLKEDQFEVLKGVESISIETDNSDLVYIFYEGKDLGVFGSGGKKQKMFSKTDKTHEESL